jgi:hypothetical protein
MGTSNSYGGPGGTNPLVPTWLGGDSSSLGRSDNGDGNDNNGDNENGTDADQDGNDDNNVVGLKGVVAGTQINASSDRFRNARTNFTTFAKSGGKDRRALGRSISNYISKSSGGSRRAAQRMGSSRAATVGLISFLNSVRTQGTRATLEALNLGSLVGKSIEEVFAGLTDHICPDGGSVDEGIARNAYIETIADLAEQGITGLDHLTIEQVQVIIEIFATSAIEARLCNDIGTKICFAPSNIDMVERAQQQLHDFISRGVSDALNQHQTDVRSLTSIDTGKFVDRIYVEAFTILQALAEYESDSK